MQGAKSMPLNGKQHSHLIIMIPVYIQDNFYTDPDKVRQYALSQTYELEYPSKTFKDTSIGKLWPGLATELLSRDKFIDTSVSKLVGKVLRSKEVSGFFRLSKADDDYDVRVHVDHVPSLNSGTQYQAVVYLSKPEDCYGKIGTKFLRHKETGKIKLDSGSEYWAVQQDFRDVGKWEVYFTVDCVYNRLVVFESNYFHDVGDIFGDSIDNGRLAQILNFHEIVIN